MLLLNVEMMVSLVDQPHFQAKMVFNDRGAIFLPVSSEHREHKAEGISYEDNYKGDALAAMLGPGKIEIRYHEEFTDREVARIVRSLLEEPELSFMKGWRATYQGRSLESSEV